MIGIAGPYIGDFEQEIITFRPYIRWVFQNTEVSKMYVNTHFNRMFLYENFIPAEQIIPVPEHLSRAEMEQSGYIHNLIAPKDFNILVKMIKEDVIGREGCTKRDLEMFTLSYIKSTTPYSIYQKLFHSIDGLDIKNPFKGKIIYIPYNDKHRRLKAVKEFLADHDSVIMGDQSTRFKDDNVVLSRSDYFSNGWKTIIKAISEAKALICPVSYWSVIGNLQQVPVFTWGENVGQFKEGGIYSFNKKCTAIATIKIDVIIEMIEHFLEEI
jgi:hypothetical protein